MPGIRKARTLLEAHLAFTMPFGMFCPPIAYAMVLQRHMHRFGTTAEQMGQVAVTTRARAARNPRAVMGDRPMTMDDYHGLPVRLRTVPALRLLPGERRGLCRGRHHRPNGPPIWPGPRSRSWGAPRGRPGVSATASTANVGMPDDDYTSAGARTVAARLWASAGLGPADIDVAQIYDHFTGLVLLSLEDFGFCPRGQGGPFAASGVLAWPDGALPTNTHGGSLSEAYIHGLNHVVEGVRQTPGRLHHPGRRGRDLSRHLGRRRPHLRSRPRPPMSAPPMNTTPRHR